MKKITAILMCLCMIFTSIVGCSSSASEPASDSSNENGFTVVTTNFAIYDWAKTIIGDDDNVKLIYLLESGVDSHSYQPSADDIVNIAGCDLFIYVGGESDTWVDGVLDQATNDDMQVLNLMEVLGDDARAEETVEGMEVSEHHHHEDEEEHDHEHEEEHHHADEHVWLSLRLADALVSAIGDELATMNSVSADTYAANCDDYLAKLADLDSQYTAAVESAENDTILLADRFPFLYLVSDYDLNYFAAFNGCSAETEASFETIAFLAGKVDELGLDTILTIEGVQHKIAETVSAVTSAKNQTILVLDSMQSTTGDDIAAGANYYDIMTENLAVLTTALG